MDRPRAIRNCCSRTHGKHKAENVIMKPYRYEDYDKLCPVDNHGRKFMRARSQSWCGEVFRITSAGARLMAADHREVDVRYRISLPGL
jgi:hypothetical protein